MHKYVFYCTCCKNVRSIFTSLFLFLLLLLRLNLWPADLAEAEPVVVEVVAATTSALVPILLSPRNLSPVWLLLLRLTSEIRAPYRLIWLLATLTLGTPPPPLLSLHSPPHPTPPCQLI